MKTIFTKIANKEIPAYIIDENDKYMAFLDIMPAVYGQVLVIPKEWKDSFIFNNEDEFISDFMKYIKKISLLIDSKLGSKRCRLIFEGLDVNHLHAKLYPVIGEYHGEEFNPSQRVEFNEKIAKEIISKFS